MGVAATQNCIFDWRELGAQVNRLESTIGNFGIWVQLTLAILIFRAILGISLLMIRTIRRGKR
jgi:hypothetical protein